MSNNPLKKESQGLGDTIEKVAFIATLGRIKPMNQNMGRKKKDCGCKKRKQALNKKANYKGE